MGLLNWIFKTTKEWDEDNNSQFAGQTSKQSFKELHDVAARITNQKIVSGSATDNTTSFQTADYYVDFVDKSALNDEVNFSKLKQNPNIHVEDNRTDIEPVIPWFLKRK